MRFTIAHFSDIHVTASPADIPWRALLSKRFVGWLNLRFSGRYERFREAAEITRALVDDIEALDPDHVLFTGDLTGVALREEFTGAREALEPLLARIEHGTITGTPGNQDVYVRSALREGVYHDLFGAWETSERGDTPPIVRFLSPELVLVALIDSRPAALYDSSGRVGDEQLDRLDRLLDDPEIRARRVVLALHYGPRRGDGSPDTRLHGLRDAEELLERVKGRVDLLVHGHLHQRFVLPRGSTTPVTIANPGSATYSRYDRAFHVLRFDGSELELETRRFDPESRKFVRWSDAPGSGALKGREQG